MNQGPKIRLFRIEYRHDFWPAKQWDTLIEDLTEMEATVMINKLTNIRMQFRKVSYIVDNPKWSKKNEKTV